MTKPYCIGSDDWNGLSKLIEELNELGEVCGKLIGSEGDTNHWTGDLRKKFVEEIGDVQAAMNFFVDKNFSITEKVDIARQAGEKYTTFTKWDKEIRDAEA